MRRSTAGRATQPEEPPGKWHRDGQVERHGRSQTGRRDASAEMGHDGELDRVDGHRQRGESRQAKR
jgi:hypothetical protein